jgi:hypothetical protein
MLKKSILFLVVAVMLLITSACNNREAASTAPIASLQPEAEASVSATEPPQTEPTASPTELDQPDGPNILTEILECAPEEITGFSYYDEPKLLVREDGSPFPDYDEIITYACDSSGLFADVGSSYTREIADALAGYQLTEASEAVTGDIPLPTGKYLVMIPVRQDWTPILTFFDSGEVYVEYNIGGYGPKRWHAADPARFGELKELLDGIHDELDALPLEYQVESWLDYGLFRPESPGLRLVSRNIGVDPITAKSFLIERKEGGVWSVVGEADASDFELAPRQDYTRYSVNLMEIPGAQEVGEYRVTATLEGGGKEPLSLELTYQISEDATDISYMTLPKMTPENQEYCDRYIWWGFYSPFTRDFDEKNYLTEFHVYHLYFLMSNAEGTYDENHETYGVDILAEIVEETIMRHFLFSEEQIRGQMASKEYNGSEYYDPESNTYHFEGGYGGGSNTAVVSDSRWEGDLLTMTVDWYGMDDSYLYSQELTLRIGEGEYDFVYVAGRMLDE